MRKQKERLVRAVSALVLCMCCILPGCQQQSVQQMQQKEVSGNANEENMVLLGGMPIGLYLETDGIMVLSTEAITGQDGNQYNPADNIVKPGDYIFELNGLEVKDKKDLIQDVEQLDGADVILGIRREDELLQVRLCPVLGENGYKLGIWVRDNVQGLGTITYLDSESNFASLGHGIHDLDTGKLLAIDYGSVYKTSIRSVQKGKNGVPGSMEGIIVYNNYNKLGSVLKNTETGVFGHLDKMEELFSEQVPIALGKKEEVQDGTAYIRCCVNGEIDNYEIKISNIDLSEKEINKNFEIEICDKNLLDLTGGIIQGMSGSPIIQNGKLIGAVTHVFVQDATKGYGVFIENMSID
ncbi:MAG: SpoIVB peptidase S55 domain-containing protein [Hespellia sp.]|nr:SpoIVB peptidase S55 domain-containing protein [Hespellia sp.]